MIMTGMVAGISAMESRLRGFPSGERTICASPTRLNLALPHLGQGNETPFSLNFSLIVSESIVGFLSANIDSPFAFDFKYVEPPVGLELLVGKFQC